MIYEEHVNFLAGEMVNKGRDISTKYNIKPVRKLNRGLRSAGTLKAMALLKRLEGQRESQTVTARKTVGD